MRQKGISYLLVFLSILSLLFFGYKALNAYLEMNRNQQSANTIKILSDIAKLENLYAKEKFYSVLYLGVNGVNYLDELEDSRKRLDKFFKNTIDRITRYKLSDSYIQAANNFMGDIKNMRMSVDSLDKSKISMLTNPKSNGLVNELYNVLGKDLKNVETGIKRNMQNFIAILSERRSILDERTLAAAYISAHKKLDMQELKSWELALEGKGFSLQELINNTANLIYLKSDDMISIKSDLADIRGDIFEHIGNGRFETKLYEIEDVYGTALERINNLHRAVASDTDILTAKVVAQKRLRLMQYLAAALVSLIILLLVLKSLSSSRKEKLVLEESLKEIVSDLDEERRKELELIINKGDRSAIYRFLSRTALDARAAEERALQAEKTKDLFLANMSHEIRTPLNGILGFTQLMRSTPLNPEQEEFMDVIAGSSENLLKIVNDILDLSKIRAGKIELETIQFSIIEHLEKAIEPHAAKALEKGIEYSAFIDPSLPLVLGDPTKLMQVMTNLIGNAVKFTNEGGSVNVEARKIREQDGKVTIHFSVKDSGIGIEPEQIQKIFEPFSQADISTTREFGGTGLGLTITKDIISHMGGMLDVASEKGKGSEFYFELTFDIAGNDENLQERLKGVSFAYFHSGESALRQMERNLAQYIRASGGRYRVVSEQELDTIDDIDVLLLDYTDKETREKIDILLGLDKKIILISTAKHKSLTDKISHIVDRIIYRPLTASKIIRAYESMIAAGDKQESNDGDKSAISLSGLRILVAEDNPINQKLIVRVLSDMGIDSTVASDGQEAYEKYISGEFDAVLMDIQMPVMGGVEATKKILEHEHDKGMSHTPIIALTANALQGDREKYLRKGFDDYISKPINLGQLSQVLKTMISAEENDADQSKEETDKAREATLAPNKKSILMFSNSSELIHRIHKDALTFAGYEFMVENDIKKFFETLGTKRPYYVIIDGRSIGSEECMLVELLKGRELSVYVLGSIDSSLTCSGVFEEYNTVSEYLRKIS